MKNIYIYTGSYPYNKASECFLDAEVNTIDNVQNKITFIPAKKDTFLRKLKPNILLDTSICNRSLFSNIKAVLQIFTSGLFFQYLQSGEKVKNKKFMLDLFKYLYATSLVYSDLKDKAKTKEPCVFYSYWLTYAPIAFSLYKTKNKNTIHKFISRGHGSDVYTVDVGIYYPLREFIFKNIDKVYLVSNYGLNYLQNKYPSYKDKFALSRLGVLSNVSIDNPKANDNIIRLVSCSRVCSIKRVDLLFKSIYYFAKENYNITIEWMHIGDGELFPLLKEEVETLPAISNLNVVLRGNLNNSDILKLYRENLFNCFLLISITEGVPVSIMEAIASKIPVLATEVGGVNEIVNSQTGSLLKVDFTQQEFDKSLHSILNNFDNLSETSYEFFKNNYDAELNYKEFYKYITTI